MINWVHSIPYPSFHSPGSVMGCWPDSGPLGWASLLACPFGLMGVRAWLLSPISSFFSWKNETGELSGFWKGGSSVRLEKRKTWGLHALVLFKDTLFHASPHPNNFPFFWMISQSCHNRGKAWRGFKKKISRFLLPDQYTVVIQYVRGKVQVWDTCERTGQAENSWGDR